MEGKMPPTEKMKTSDGEEMSDSEEENTVDYRKLEQYMTPVVKKTEWKSLDTFRYLCDFVMKPWTGLEDDDDSSSGGVSTMINADRVELMRDFAKLCLNFYNDNKRSDFELVKVLKANVGYHYYLSFTAKEYGIGGQPFVFRGCVCVIPKRRPIFCEMKENDNVTLLPGDENYAGSSGTMDKAPGALSLYTTYVRKATMEGKMCPAKKMKTSVGEEMSDSEEETTIDYRKFEKYMTPVAKKTEGTSLKTFRYLCDFVMEPRTGLDDDDDEPSGGVFTVTNADRKELMRDFAKLCLNFYNENKRSDFELVKVLKANVGYDYYLSFTAKEYGVGGQPFVFRGCVCVIPKRKPIFCEMKENDNVALLPGDENYAGSSGTMDKAPAPA